MSIKPQSLFVGEASTPQRTVLRTDQTENTYWLDFSRQFEMSESPSPSPSPPPPTQFEISESPLLPTSPPPQHTKEYSQEYS